MTEDYVTKQREHNKVEQGSEYSYAWRRLVKDRVRVLCAFSGPRPLRKGILDVGCRNATALDHFRLMLGGDVRLVGVDIVPEFVAESGEHEVYTEDIHDLSRFKDREFDWVFAHHVLEHCEHPAKAASELRRVSDAILVVVPMEADVAGNPAHFCASTDPLDWCDHLRDPGWRLLVLQVQSKGDCLMVFARKEIAMGPEHG